MVEEFISPSFIGTSTAATAEGRHPTRQSSRNINPYFSRLFIFQYQITPILTPSPRFYCPVPDIFFHTRVFAGRRQMAQQHPHRPHRNRAKPADDVGARLHDRGDSRPSFPLSGHDEISLQETLPQTRRGDHQRSPCYGDEQQCDVKGILLANVFDKPNDQRELVFFGMARKRPHEMER